MKKTIFALALLASFGAAQADCGGGNGSDDPPSNGCQPGGNNGGGTGGNGGAGGNGGTGGAGGNGGAGGSATANATAAAIAAQLQLQLQRQSQSSTNTNTNTVTTTGTVGNVSGGSSTVRNSGNSTIQTGAVQNTVTGGAGGSASIAQGAVSNTVSTGGNTQTVTTTGTVGNVSTGSQTVTTTGTVGNVSGGSIASGAVSVTLNTVDPNAGTRDLTDLQIANINAATSKEVAKINADAARDVANSKIRNTPSVNGPALTSSNDTCMGSTSGSANAPGIGLSFGTSWVDSNCKMLKNSRELWNMGMKAAAMALMCNDADNRQALELTGYECPKARDDSAKPQAKAAATQEQYTDPIIRARLGLAPLAK